MTQNRAGGWVRKDFMDYVLRRPVTVGLLVAYKLADDDFQQCLCDSCAGFICLNAEMHSSLRAQEISVGTYETCQLNGSRGQDALLAACFEKLGEAHLKACFLGGSAGRDNIIGQGRLDETGGNNMRRL